MVKLYEGYYYTLSKKEAKKHNAKGGFYQKVQIYGHGAGFEKKDPREMANWGDGGGAPAQFYRWKAEDEPKLA